jgi:hypothetical protein
VAGSRNHGDEHSGSGSMELVICTITLVSFSDYKFARLVYHVGITDGKTGRKNIGR